ncbi:DNA methyltransferase [Sulfuritalea sp.]|uniref:DNA methyltransferase n=1 Tax=Sulfuritalea sp. TaxID=2480090 RepID=UPI001ACC02B0|nr:DNA methyltransferase [Sulfuritalea sp.]MBN8473704.1 class I SAM-dependent DNA methyltransferase [Sulfuritalea sp.]
MPLLWSDIRANAQRFAKDWADATSERAEAQTFWNEFFAVFGVQRRRVAVYEKTVSRLKHAGLGRIDVFWPGLLLAEHKSAGADLDAAFQQAADYFEGLNDKELPRYVVVSDFARFVLYDLEDHTRHELTLKEFPRKIHLFGFIAGYRRQKVREQDPINVEAVQKMGDLHDLLKRDGYEGHVLEVFLVRLLFCLFADDTGIFQPKDALQDLIENHTAEDGSDLGDELHRLFVVLNTPYEKRQKSLPDIFTAFPYVNGRLFEERLDPPVFNREMRGLLTDLCSMNWGAISPAIFGAMFQAVIELDARDRRRQLGAHYTSEANILKLIGPLFLDELWIEFERVKTNKNQLFEFQKKLSRLAFLDPACGCGNFLVISYRELRRLEIEVLRAAEKLGQRWGNVFQAITVDVDQFYGIEIEEFPAQVAQVAMWLTDHQMNIEASEVFGEPILRIPLVKSAHIRHGNALQLDWASFVPPTRLNYILGNPPFVGKKERTLEQKADLEGVTTGIHGAGVLDFVAGWYVKAARYLTADINPFSQIIERAAPGKKKFKDVRFGKGEKVMHDMFLDAAEVEVKSRRAVRCAFVSTNSITQGEQVGVLWGWLLNQGLHIQFAHRTFQWMNEAPGKAAVHCVIVGFGTSPSRQRRLFEYDTVDGPPHEVKVTCINPYLVDATEIVISKRTSPVSAVRGINYGSMAIDDGHLILSPDERNELLAEAPQAERYVRPLMGGDEFLNDMRRYCLWLADAPATDIGAIRFIAERVKRVREFRLGSGRPATRNLAATPSLFGEIRQPTRSYLLIPKVSSERRTYMPLGILSPGVVASGSALVMPDATLWHFGVLSSTMHMAWMRAVCGRMKSDYQYSAQIVYNNFSWPTAATEKQSTDLEAAAQAVLDARAAEFKRDAATTLATLYDPDLMPPALVKAHQALDRAVDAAYSADAKGLGFKGKWGGDRERVAFLFALYQRLTSLGDADTQ